MPHTKEKKMINTNRAVVVNFEGNANMSWGNPHVPSGRDL